MSDAKRQMHIRLSPAQTQRLLDWARELSSAHVEADCEPPGYELRIAVGAGYPASIEAIAGSNRLDLGDIDVELEHH